MVGVALTLNHRDPSRGDGRDDTSLSHVPSVRVCLTFCLPVPVRCAIRGSQVRRPLDYPLQAAWNGGGSAMPGEESLAVASARLQRCGGGATARSRSSCLALRRDTLPHVVDAAEA